jgi:hypothetical protein
METRERRVYGGVERKRAKEVWRIRKSTILIPGKDQKMQRRGKRTRSEEEGETETSRVKRREAGGMARAFNCVNRSMEAWEAWNKVGVGVSGVCSGVRLVKGTSRQVWYGVPLSRRLAVESPLKALSSRPDMNGSPSSRPEGQRPRAHVPFCICLPVGALCQVRCST